LVVLCAVVALAWANTNYAGNSHGGGSELCYVPRHTNIVALTELPPSYGLGDNVAFLKKGASVIIECDYTNPYTRKKSSFLKAFKCTGHDQMLIHCFNKGIKLTEEDLLVLYKDVETPHEAERQCLLKGATLASITGPAENSMAVSLMAYAEVNTALIGLTDRGFEGYYTWMDGSTSKWSNWYRGYPRFSTPQPNDHGAGEDYVVIQREGANGRWFDVGPPRLDSNTRLGNSSFSYICKFKEITFTTEGYLGPADDGHCPGGSEYNTCANQCLDRTCKSPFKRCYNSRNFRCIPDCKCPDHLPILEDNRCITYQQCSAPEPVTPTCDHDMVYRECPSVCTATCKEPTPTCTRQCGEPGCVCPSGRVLHEGRCIAERDCPSEPECSGGQFWDSCANACSQQTCSDRFQTCAITHRCEGGCKCPRDRPYLHQGQCVKSEGCNTISITCLYPKTYQTCGSACTATCDNPVPICTLQCKAGCACPANRPIEHNGRCVAQHECPRRPTCSGGQVYNSCANVCTQRTCSDRVEACAADLPCREGCKCPASRPILHNGRCITERSCPRVPVQCDSNLVHNACGSPCTPTCNDPNPVCTKRCENRCECPRNLPILHNGQCIRQSSCPRDPVVGTERCQSSSVTSYRDECDRLCTCSGSTLDYCCRERKAFSNLSNSEKDRLLRAMLLIATDAQYRPDWIRLTKIHVDNFRSAIHTASQFLPWHREYLYLYEDLLRKVDCKITLPFWDWTKEREGTIYNSEIFSTLRGFGGDGSGASQCISVTYFNYYRLSNNQCIKRDFIRGGNCAADRWPTINQMKKLVKELSDQARFETFIRGVWHNTIHNCFGEDSTLRGFSSAEEPMFVLHHAMVDYAWWSWQQYHSDNTWPDDRTRLIGFSNKRVSSVLISERMRGGEGVCYLAETGRDLTAPDTAFSRTAGADDEVSCAMSPESTLADDLTEQELADIAEMNLLLGTGSGC